MGEREREMVVVEKSFEVFEKKKFSLQSLQKRVQI